MANFNIKGEVGGDVNNAENNSTITKTEKPKEEDGVKLLKIVMKLIKKWFGG